MNNKNIKGRKENKSYAAVDDGSKEQINRFFEHMSNHFKKELGNNQFNYI